MIYDILIVGGGPAGLCAALYARRAGKTALVIEKNTFGGQITWSPRVENFPTERSISGLALADKMLDQAMGQGADIELDEVVSAEKKDGLFYIKTAFGSEFCGKAIIIATGAEPRRLGLDNEEKFIGQGISFCAVCDGEFYKDKVVAVVGGGNTALQETLYLSDICRRVYLIHRRDEFRADKALCDVLPQKNNVETVLNSFVAEILGDTKIEGVKLENKSGEEREISLDGLFIAVGHKPENQAFAHLVPLDDSGYADVGESCEAHMDGVFVAGDCRKKSVRQLTTAVSDGAVAALAACAYIDKM